MIFKPETSRLRGSISYKTLKWPNCHAGKEPRPPIISGVFGENFARFPPIAIDRSSPSPMMSARPRFLERCSLDGIGVDRVSLENDGNSRLEWEETPQRPALHLEYCSLATWVASGTICFGYCHPMARFFANASAPANRDGSFSDPDMRVGGGNWATRMRNWPH